MTSSIALLKREIIPMYYMYYKRIGPQTALLLITFMKYEIVQFLLYEYLEESPNCVYIPTFIVHD